MAEKLNKTQDKLKRVIAHLGVIAGSLREIANVLRNCRDIEDRMLREGCGKKPERPCQELENNRRQPCTKKSRVYIRWNKAPDPCLDYEDYDPCESGEDITEKDLAVLLKEEEAKLRREKERAEAEARGQWAEEAGKTSDDVDPKGKAEGREGAGGREAGGARPCHRMKKRLCRKLIKNPFFTNRLRFSTDLPPPPPVPPPQFFPPVADSDSKLKVCPKRRKKCKKKSEKRENDEEGEEEERDEEEGVGRGGQVERTAKPQDEGQCDCLESEDERERVSREEDVDDHKKGKRRCRKPGDRPPCRKNSQVSISLQPRHIPALQRDLPPTCPKDIPEVERQIMMACGNDCEIDCGKKKCKKKSEKIK